MPHALAPPLLARTGCRSPARLPARLLQDEHGKPAKSEDEVKAFDSEFTKAGGGLRRGLRAAASPALLPAVLRHRRPLRRNRRSPCPAGPLARCLQVDQGVLFELILVRCAEPLGLPALR